VSPTMLLAQPAPASPNDDPFSLGLAIYGMVLVYFAPTIVALARQRGAGGQTFIVNLFFGWTVVGWLFAWVLAFRHRRPRLTVLLPLSPPAPLLVAPDGRYWWGGRGWVDGVRWRPSWAITSPDGHRWWSGTVWMPRRLPTPALIPEPSWWERINDRRAS
jgi:hypothetical protein